MTMFISYSRRDEDVVKALTRGLEAAGVDVWRDHELHGGDSWWSVILERIRGCSVFVFALSDTSLHRSKPCRAELEYAMLLRRPIVPVQVGTLSSMRAMPLADLQVVPYRTDDATSGFAVLAAVHQAGARTVPLPEPMPPSPPIPYGYLLALSKKIDVGDLVPAEQVRIVDDLRRAGGSRARRHHPDAYRHAGQVLDRRRRRPRDRGRRRHAQGAFGHPHCRAQRPHRRHAQSLGASPRPAPLVDRVGQGRAAPCSTARLVPRPMPPPPVAMVRPRLDALGVQSRRRRRRPPLTRPHDAIDTRGDP
jgi:hypothetical protein